MKVTTIGLSVTALSLVGALSGPVLAQPAPGSLEIQDSVFISAAGDSVPAQYGYLWVPEKREGNGDRLVRLAFVRFPSTAAEPGAPLVYLAGGPDQSGISAARGIRFPLFMALRGAGDVIALDQRGTGDAIPRLPCPRGWSFPLDQPLERPAFLSTLLEWSRGCAAYWTGIGVDLTGYNAVESADDLEALRIALGADQLNLWGIGYGAQLALATMRRHPTSVSRAVLVGAQGTDQTFGLPNDTEATLARIDSLVRADSAASALLPDFEGTVRTVLDVLRSQPLELSATNPETGDTIRLNIGAYDLERLTAQSLTSAALIAQLPVLYRLIAGGDVGLIAQDVAVGRAGRSDAVRFAVYCASGASPERLARIAEQSREALLEDALDFPFPNVCEAWPHAELGEDYRAPVESVVPTLLISGTLDPLSPVREADEVRRGLPNSGHLILVGASHGNDLLLATPRVGEAMLEFFSGGAPADERIELPFAIAVPTP